MPAELRFTVLAEQDVYEAYAWYEDRRAGLGDDFLDRVEACVRAIQRTPELHSRVHQDYRRALVRRFPYAVFFELSGATVTVHAVLHTARNPAKWRQRLP
jgi:plasmid stabilization system protein ParE